MVHRNAPDAIGEVAVPAAGSEPRLWTGAAGMSRRKSAPAEYRSAVPAVIAGIEVVLPAALAADVDDATAAVARADAYLEAALGSSAGPMRAVLMRSESSSSSRIENITAGAAQLAIAELGAEAGRNAMMVSRNVAAMRAAVELSENLDEGAVLAMHRALMGGVMRDAGRWRDVPVWIGAPGSTPVQAAFVPPAAERVPEAMADLSRFLARQDMPPLVQAAIAHAQFETVHPFPDGNGRTGRALMHSVLRGKGLTRNVTVPLSAGLLADVDAYFDSLAAYREGDAAPMISIVADAAILASGMAVSLVDRLTAIQREWGSRLPSRRGSAARRALDVIIGQPAVNAEYLARTLGVNPPAAYNAIERLEEAGILKAASDKRRNRVWTAPEAISVLDEFAESMARRR